MTLQRVRNIINRCKLKTWTARQLANMRKDGFVTTSELANRFNVSPVTYRHWARTGSIESRTLPCASEITHVHRAASGYASELPLGAARIKHLPIAEHPRGCVKMLHNDPIQDMITRGVNA